MTSTCSHCSRPLLSRQHGAAKVLLALRRVDEDRIPIDDDMELSIRAGTLDEIRAIANDMLCFCERSVAEVEAA